MHLLAIPSALFNAPPTPDDNRTQRHKQWMIFVQSSNPNLWRFAR